DAEKLLKGALTELGRKIPEVWVVPEFEENEQGTKLQVRLEKETSVISVGKLNGLYDLHITLQKLMKHLLIKNPQLKQLKIEQLLARGILKQLDAYSVLLANDIYQEFNINIGGQFAGVGLVVGTRDGQLTVVAPMDGSPAAQAGMEPLDRIVAVDDEETEHLTLDEILNRLRGETGTPVTLSVLRKGHAKALKFELLREEIKVESVETFDLQSASQT
ncbi:MAG: S41 family peptidase, partial [bacterium]